MADQLGEAIAELAQRGASLFVGPRPGKKSVDSLKALRLTHCCTLLSEREGARSIEKFCHRLACKWVWLPMEGGRLDVLRLTDMAGLIRTLLDEVGDEPEPRIYFHCSAGIHRTGFFVYVLLRLFGLERVEALAELAALRPVTAEQVGEARIDLADTIASTLAFAEGN